MENSNFVGVLCQRFGFLAIWIFSSLIFFSPLLANADDTKSKGKSDRFDISTRKTKKGKANRKENEFSKLNKNFKNDTNAKTAESTYRSMSAKFIRQRLLMDKPFEIFTVAEKKQIRRELEILRDRKTTQQFLTIIQIAEGGGPNIIVKDKPGCRVNNLRKHPAEALSNKCYDYYYNKKGQLVFSTAAGNYQITLTNYRKLAPFLDINDFEIGSQQLLALELIRRGGRKPLQVKEGVLDLYRGNVRGAVKKATPDWAAIPGSDLEGRKYDKFGKTVDGVIKGSIGLKSENQSLLPSKNGKIFLKEKRKKK